MDEHPKMRLMGLLAIGFMLGRLADIGLRRRQPKVPVAQHQPKADAAG
jgi:hypothetical protein